MRLCARTRALLPRRRCCVHVPAAMRRSPPRQRQHSLAPRGLAGRASARYLSMLHKHARQRAPLRVRCMQPPPSLQWRCVAPRSQVLLALPACQGGPRVAHMLPGQWGILPLLLLLLLQGARLRRTAPLLLRSCACRARPWYC